MPEGVIVDTDILIDAGRNVTAAITCLDHIEQRYALAVRVVTQVELLVGCGNKSELKQQVREKPNANP